MKKKKKKGLKYALTTGGEPVIVGAMKKKSFKEWLDLRESAPEFKNRQEYEKWKAELKQKELENAKKTQEDFLKRTEQFRKKQ